MRSSAASTGSRAPRWRRSLALTALAVLPALMGHGAASAAPAVDFEREVRPLFERHCASCHGAAKQKGGLRLDSRLSVFRPDDPDEASVVAGRPEASELMRRLVDKDDDERMPPEKPPLPAAEVALIERWIRSGAPFPTVEPKRREMTVTEEDRRHWAFRPLTAVAPPAGAEANAIDRFVRAAQRARGIAPAPEADRRTLARRLWFVALGLPPVPAEVDRFTGDRAPRAFERLADRALASPHFGERWARHWLDVARYADSAGYERDPDRASIHKYRDFVIRAFNDDLPFDTFVRWQLAGDEYRPDDPLALAATGFVAAGPQLISDTKLADELARYRYADLDDMITTTGAAMLGLTVGCARCHDHKSDAIPTRDYYRMLSAFLPVKREEAPLLPRAAAAAHIRAVADHERQLGEARKALSALLALKRPLTAPERRELERKARLLARLEAARPRQVPHALVVRDAGDRPEPSRLMERGDPQSPGATLSLGFLSVLGTKTPEAYWDQAKQAGTASGVRTTFQRRALAEWLTDAPNGAGALLARVIVNRLWQHHFGEGLVRTPSDFGVQGDRPVLPGLLDWLAGELVRGGWRLKPIHRLILTSATWRQANVPAVIEQDPENRLLSRRRPARLDAEALRDGLLAVSGRLQTRMYGPGFKPPIPPELMLAYNNIDPYPKDARDAPETWRRAVYLFTKRSVRHPFMEVFDGADPSASCARRLPTTVAPQALALLNDPFVRARAHDLGQRLAVQANTDETRVAAAYRLTLARPPSDEERAEGAAFLRARREAGAGDALADFAQVLFASNEFLHVD